MHCKIPIPYVDKSVFVQNVLLSPEKILLIPRPRRFGKTLNLSLLHTHLSQAGVHPVISLRLSDPRVAEDPLQVIRRALMRCCREHQGLLREGALSAEDRAELHALMKGEASEESWKGSLDLLSRCLFQVRRRPVYILVDDYDAPALGAVQLGRVHADVSAFLREVFDRGLRKNDRLWKAVLLGNLPGAWAGLSPDSAGPGAIYVDSPMSDRFATSFGLTDYEVDRLVKRAVGSPLTAAQLGDKLRRWYGGHRYGRHELFHPYSTLSCLASLDHQLRPYFASTRSNKVAREALLRGGANHTRGVLALLAGAGLIHSITEDIDLDLLVNQWSIGSAAEARAQLSFLLYKGYLTWRGEKGRREDGTPLYSLTLPNQEVRWLLRALCRQWLAERLDSPEGVKRLVQVVLQGRASMLGLLLSCILLKDRLLSRTASNLERVYHGLALGLAVHLGEGHRVCLARPEPSAPKAPRQPSWEAVCETNERRRYDLVVVPRAPGGPGVVLQLEVKRLGRNPPRMSLEEALRELQRRNYAARLRQQGVQTVHEMVVLCNHKHAFVASSPDLPSTGPEMPHGGA